MSYVVPIHCRKPRQSWHVRVINTAAISKLAYTFWIRKPFPLLWTKGRGKRGKKKKKEKKEHARINVHTK